MTSTVGARRDLAGLRRDWTLAMVIGELIGFVAPAVTGATLAAIGAPDAVLVVGLTIAGLVEGAAIGTAQAVVLADHAPEVDRRAWVVATVIAAGFAWFVGMGGGALMGGTSVAPAVLLVLLVPVWTAALLSMGFAQWLVLRRTIPRSGRWVPVTSGAWLLGMMVPIVGLTAAPNAWPAWAHVVIAVASAVVMGLIVGLLTGHTLHRLLVRDDGRPASRDAGPSTLPLGRAETDDEVSDRAARGRGGHRPLVS